MSGASRPASAFTIRAKDGRLNQLVTACFVSDGFDPRAVVKGAEPAMRSYQAIWDTGATGSVVTRRVVDECGLKQVGVVRVSTANGIRDSGRYIANIMLPNKLGFPMLSVTEGEIAGDVEVLIGMDIITRGDFAITHLNGKTVFSFRYPSLAEYDYVKESNDAAARAAGGARRPPPSPGQSFFSGKKKR